MEVTSFDFFGTTLNSRLGVTSFTSSKYAESRACFAVILLSGSKRIIFWKNKYISRFSPEGQAEVRDFMNITPSFFLL